MESIRPAIGGGIVAGLAGLVVFFLLHHLWIVPIWFIGPLGASMASLGGAAVGASYASLRPSLPGRPWTTVAVVAIVTGTLAPGVAVAVLHGPVSSLRSGGSGTVGVSWADALLASLVGLTAVTGLSGAIIGAFVGRTRRAVVTTMVAGIALALGPGHNIPLLGGTSVAKELAILGLVVLTSATVLVLVEARLSRRSHERWQQAAGGSLGNQTTDTG